MNIQAIIPILPTHNIESTIMFYETKLGFEGIDKGGYAILKKGTCELHFLLCTDKIIAPNAVCYIKVSDIESLYIELSAFNLINLKERLEHKPRGMKEFSIKDNNGNLLKFTEQQ